MNNRQILKQIILKGGLFALCAKQYIDDEEKAKQFIKECFEQCHNKLSLDLWGDTPMAEIINATKQS